MTRVVLVHERLTELGGSERVVEQFAQLWPDARLAVGVASDEIRPGRLATIPLTTSLAQRWHRNSTSYAHLLPLLPSAFARLDLDDADLIVTSHHAFANRIKAPAGVPVISYTHTPARWMWSRAMRHGEQGGLFGRAALAAFAATQRRADRAAAQRLSSIVANSRSVAERIRRWWGREAMVIPPPVDVEFYRPDRGVAREDFFLYAGRLVPYKRPDLVVAAASQAGVPLVVAGDGRARPSCEALAGPLVELVGRVGDDELRSLYRRCRGLIFAGEEDFGIIPVEAQACGAPVLALDAGGVRDSVVDGVTGALIGHADLSRPAMVEAFVGAIKTFAPDDYDPRAIRDHAASFGADRFRDRMTAHAKLILDLEELSEGTTPKAP